jgi:hypothetical protein
MNSIGKLGKLTPHLELSIRCSQSINELDHIVSKALNVCNYYICATHSSVKQMSACGLLVLMIYEYTQVHRNSSEWCLISSNIN